MTSRDTLMSYMLNLILYLFLHALHKCQILKLVHSFIHCHHKLPCVLIVESFYQKLYIPYLQ